MVDLYSSIQTFINAHLAVYLIWRRDSTAKDAKKNTSPNVICLQYCMDTVQYIHVEFFGKDNLGEVEHTNL